MDVENADDLRLSVKLFRVCLADKQQFCADVPPGNAQAKDCLEEHRHDPGFSPECRCSAICGGQHALRVALHVAECASCTLQGSNLCLICHNDCLCRAGRPMHLHDVYIVL
jgi:Cysteine rich repeat